MSKQKKKKRIKKRKYRSKGTTTLYDLIDISKHLILSIYVHIYH